MGASGNICWYEEGSYIHGLYQSTHRKLCSNVNSNNCDVNNKKKNIVDMLS